MNAYWIYAENRNGKQLKHTEYGGKWLIFVGAHNALRIWNKIKIATEEGRLGSMSKIAIAKNSAEFSKSKTRVVCVYTYDWRDEKDARRVREELRRLGIIRKIPYKTDEDTELGVYQNTNVGKVSKYYE